MFEVPKPPCSLLNSLIYAMPVWRRWFTVLFDEASNTAEPLLMVNIGIKEILHHGFLYVIIKETYMWNTFIEEMT